MAKGVRMHNESRGYTLYIYILPKLIYVCETICVGHIWVQHLIKLVKYFYYIKFTISNFSKG